MNNEMNPQQRTLESPQYWEAIWNAADESTKAYRIPGVPEDAINQTTVYTTIRTYHRSEGNTRYLRLEKHFERLNDSLSLEGMTSRVNEPFIRQAIKLVEKDCAIRGEIRLKILVVAGHPNRYFLISEPLVVPGSDAYQLGADVFTTRFVRENPRVKSYDFVSTQEQIRNAFTEAAEEILMIDEECEILEGLSSNFFGIIHNVIQTADESILKGITRQIVLELISANGLSMDLKPVNMDEIGFLSECFITSTSRGILPVRSIDQKMIGSGKPGPITRKLMALFAKEIERLIKPI